MSAGNYIGYFAHMIDKGKMTEEEANTRLKEMFKADMRADEIDRLTATCLRTGSDLTKELTDILFEFAKTPIDIDEGILDKFNSFGCTSFAFIPEKDKPIKVVCDDGRIDVVGGENMIRVSKDLSAPTIKASKLGVLDCSHMSDEEFEELCKELELENESN